MIHDNTAKYKYLNKLYQQVSISDYKKQTKAETYGEILAPSVTKLLSQMTLNKTDIFIDFGSGIGKIVAQVFLETQVQAAYGIEVVPAFHTESLKLCQIIKQDFPFLFENRELTFLEGDFLQIPLPSATFAIINSTCFNQKLLCDLGMRINHMSSMHTVFSLRPIPTLRRLSFKKSLQVQCSWDSILCYVYG